MTRCSTRIYQAIRISPFRAKCLPILNMVCYPHIVIQSLVPGIDAQATQTVSSAGRWGYGDLPTYDYTPRHDDSRQSLKILCVIPSLSRGGAERVLSLLTRDWAKCHDVVVAAFDALRPAYHYDCRVVHLQLRMPSSAMARAHVAWTSTLRLIKLFRVECPDRIITFMEPANIPAILASSVLGILDRLVVSVRHNPNMLSLPRRLLISWLYRFPTAVVAVSHGVQRTLVSMGLPRDRVTTIPNPVLFPNADRSAAMPRARGRYVLAAGRLIPSKGFDLLLTAFSLVQPSDLTLVVLGEGPGRVQLLDLARQLRINDRVCLPGALSDISRWYRHAECFVLSSRNEGWPNVLVEAMAAACPVVSFRCDFGPEEIVEDEISGLLVATGDVDALASAITRVVTDGRLSASLADGGANRAAWFASQAAASRWLRL